MMRYPKQVRARLKIWKYVEDTEIIGYDMDEQAALEEIIERHVKKGEDYEVDMEEIEEADLE